MSTPKYWRGLEELEQSPEFLAQAEKEFENTDKSIDEVLAEATEEAMSTPSNRRDFLKVLGFGMTAATLSACAEGPVKKAIPYVSRPDTIPDEVIPGVANYYATTTPSGNPATVKTREGRPIKMAGNPDSKISGSGLSPIDEASVLDLYDTDRLRGPVKDGNLTSWDTLDNDVKSQLEQIKSKGGSVRILSHTIMSPTLKKAAGEFLGQFADGQHVTFDALSVSALAKAHEVAFGSRMIPSYHFDKATQIVAINCDFLGPWLNSEGFTHDYMLNRDPDKPMSRHLHFESGMSITGAKADMRFPVNPSQEAGLVLNLYNKLASELNKPRLRGVESFEVAGNGIELAAKELKNHQGNSLVVCGTNDVATQIVVAAINQMLGNYGKTINHDNKYHYFQGDDEAFESLVKDMEAGKVDGLFVLGANPVYNSSLGKRFGEALKKVGLTLSFANKEDETSTLCTYTAPDHHFLESWGDAQQTDLHYSLIQPTIYPVFDTRQAGASLLMWANIEADYMEYLKTNWETVFFPMVSTGIFSSFTNFWNETLRKGVFTLPASAPTTLAEINIESLKQAAVELRGMFQIVTPGVFDLVLYPKVSLGNGDAANNPWLQELPDPIQRVSWDNYVTVPIQFAEENGLKNEDVLEIEVAGQKMYMPVVVQPGQATNTLTVALGYGRSKAGRVAKRGNGQTIDGRQVAGTNVYPFTSIENGATKFTVSDVKVNPTGTTYPLALVQTFNTLYDPAKGVAFGFDYDRSEYIVEETYTAAYGDGTYKERVKEREQIKQHLVTLWDTHFEDPETQRTIHWKMAIDLNKCTGCGTCIVACNAENNVPVVGKEEVRNRREMHWLRIDRYYSGDPTNPDVVFQPMMCQHCDNAPCETVCPVLATIHSNEGLNQMTYNRCIGTRYCANNCPYKVRRFNWYNYWNDEKKFSDFYTHQKLGRLVLNPDVTVRFRGVMEKCSMCVQRLQEGKLKAKLNAKSSFAKPQDGDIKLACEESCPTDAIVFGDANDPNSAISAALRHQRTYTVLAEVKALPSVNYKTLVRNRSHEEHEAKELAFEEWRMKTYGDKYQAPKEHGGHGEGHDKSHDADHKEEAHKKGEHA